MVCWVRFAGIRSRGSLLPAAKRGRVSDLEPACDCGLFPRRAEPCPSASGRRAVLTRGTMDTLGNGVAVVCGASVYRWRGGVWCGVAGWGGAGRGVGGECVWLSFAFGDGITECR